MNNFIQKYEILLKNLNNLAVDFSGFIQIRKPKLSNLELIAMNIAAEFCSIDSECQLFREIKGSYLEQKIERSVYNKRKRVLFDYIETIRQQMSQILCDTEDHFIIDSMPLEVCKLARASRSTICKEQAETAPNKGFCAAQNLHFYGYKLHAVCTLSGVFSSIDLSAASVHDIHFLKDIQTQMSHCTLIGDKGYLSADYQLNLFETAHIKLATPMRSNQKNYQAQPYVFRKSRKRIETLFSQLCDQFLIRRNYAKTFEGFKTRILSKITALTTIQFLNKFVYNRNLNNLKIVLA